MRLALLCSEFTTLMRFIVVFNRLPHQFIVLNFKWTAYASFTLLKLKIFGNGIDKHPSAMKALNSTISQHHTSA